MLLRMIDDPRSQKPALEACCCCCYWSSCSVVLCCVVLCCVRAQLFSQTPHQTVPPVFVTLKTLYPGNPPSLACQQALVTVLADLSHRQQPPFFLPVYDRMSCSCSCSCDAFILRIARTLSTSLLLLLLLQC